MTAGTVLVSFRGGPWEGERRRFVMPPPPTISAHPGGEYRLEQSYTGVGYQWYSERTNPPTAAGGN